MRRFIASILALGLVVSLLVAPTAAHHRPGHGPRPTPTPTATPSPTPSPTPTATPSPTPTPTLAPTPTPTGGPNPLTCAGYAEPRIFLEAQGWWKGDGSESLIGSDMPYGSHVHVGTCFPWGQTVSGIVEFDVRVLMHDNLGALRLMRPQVWYDGGTLEYTIDLGDQTFIDGNGEVWQHVTLDTTRIPWDGYQELRLFTQVEQADGSDHYSSTGWMLNLNNGNPLNHYKPDAQAPAFTEGRGWYEGTEYSNARWASTARTSPVSGTWTFNVSLAAGAGGTPVTFSAVYIDPNFHAGSEGTLVRSSFGPYVGSVSINTTTLTNGVHRLVLRADSTISSGTNSGLLVIPFTVSN